MVHFVQTGDLILVMKKSPVPGKDQGYIFILQIQPYLANINSWGFKCQFKMHVIQMACIIHLLMMPVLFCAFEYLVVTNLLLEHKMYTIRQDAFVIWCHFVWNTLNISCKVHTLRKWLPPFFLDNLAWLKLIPFFFL